MLRNVLPLLAGGLVGLAGLAPVVSNAPASAEIICGTGYYLSLGQCVLVPGQPFVVAPAPVVVAPAPVIVAPVVVGGEPVYRGRYGGGAVSGPNGSYGVRGPGGATYVHTESHGNYYRR